MKLKIIAAIIVMSSFGAPTANAENLGGAANYSEVMSAYESWFDDWKSYLTSMNSSWILKDDITATGETVGDSFAVTKFFSELYVDGTNFSQTFYWNLNRTGDMLVSGIAPTVAVPGPEAGAGLGALAMAGFAYAAYRRRKATAQL